MDEERDFPRDPASLLPFVCELMPANLDAVLLPDLERYHGKKATDGDDLAAYPRLTTPLSPTPPRCPLGHFPRTAFGEMSLRIRFLQCALRDAETLACKIVGRLDHVPSRQHS
jgi:hypothetical protein